MHYIIIRYMCVHTCMQASMHASNETIFDLTLPIYLGSYPVTDPGR